MGSYVAGHRYLMTMLMGLCRGTVDELVAIRVGKRNAWIGAVQADQSGATSPLFRIDNYQLFGGDDGQGGIQGNAWLMGGGDAQVAPTTLLDKISGITGVAYRGITTLLFDGIVCAVNPYPQTWAMRARRTTNGWDGPVWYPEKAAIWLRNDSVPDEQGGVVRDIKAYNPAHILYECATNRVWGRGLPRSIIDDESYRAAADTLFNEKFGLCMKWARTDTLTAFVQSVLDHAGAAQYVDRSTGKLTLDLIRGDYNVDSIPLFTPDSGLLSIEEDTSSSTDNSISEVIVQWTDPVTGNTGQVRQQNLGAIQSQGAVNNNNPTEYPGIPTAELARRVALRDLRAQAPGLKRYKVVLDRLGRQIKPAGLFRVSHPQRGIFNVVLRAGDFQDGTLTAGSITIAAVQDVFGLPATSFGEDQGGTWTPPDGTAYPVTTERLDEVSYRDLVVSAGQAQVNTLQPEDAFVGTLARRPTPISLGYLLNTQIQGTGFTQKANGHFSPVGVLARSIGPTDTSFSLQNADNIDQVTIGSVVYIDNEMMRLDEFSADAASGTIVRGCVDTLPDGHSAGAVVWIYDDDLIIDPTKYQTGEIVDAKLLTKTSSSVLDIANATQMEITVGQRQARPYPPADVKVDGVSVYDAGVALRSGSTVSWSTRNRPLQSDNLIGYFEGTVTPEDGMTFEIDVFDGNNTVLRTLSLGISTSHELTDDDLANGGSIRVYSKLNDLRCAQSRVIYSVSPDYYYTTEDGTGSYLMEDGSYFYITEDSRLPVDTGTYYATEDGSGVYSTEDGESYYKTEDSP